MVILRGAGKIILITQVCKNEILGFKDLITYDFSTITNVHNRSFDQFRGREMIRIGRNPQGNMNLFNKCHLLFKYWI